MRKFSLYIDGVERSLNGDDGIYFENPTGLGLDLPTTTVSLRNGFFKKADVDNIPQRSINGTLVFMPAFVGTPAARIDAYDTYRVFVGNINTGAVLELGYTPDTALTATEYRIRVALDYISKGEANGDWLYCPVGFIALTPWYKTTTVNLPLVVSEGDENLYLANYTAVGSAGAAFVLTATGGGTPTYLSLYTQNPGERIGYFGLESGQEISNIGTFVYSNIPDNCYVKYTYTASGTAHEVDLVEKAYLSDLDMFALMAPNKVNQIIVFYDDGIVKPTAISAVVYNYYWSV